MRTIQFRPPMGRKRPHPNNHDARQPLGPSRSSDLAPGTDSYTKGIDMKLKIIDPVALDKISAAALAAFALNEGWTKAGRQGPFADFFEWTGSDDILVPNRNTPSDYAHRATYLIEIFAAVTGRTQLAIHRDLTRFVMDVVRVTPAGDGTGDGKFAFNSAYWLTDAVREMLFASANRSLRIDTAREFFNSLRIAQSDEDGFDITLLFPAGNTPEYPGADPSQDAGNALRAMFDGLRTLRRDADRSGEERRAGGLSTDRWNVSFTMHGSLLEILKFMPSVDFSARWELTRLGGEGTARVAFNREDAPALCQIQANV